MLEKTITTVLFDLDGTLLPMDLDAFIHTYFGLLAQKAAPYGYEPKPLIDGVWKGMGAMIQNDGACPNSPSARKWARRPPSCSLYSTSFTPKSLKGPDAL